MTPPFPPLPLPEGITESYLPSHDLNYHLLSAGSATKPLLLLLHGFPELAFSWRKIMTALAEEGYYVVAYDQRGYGRTTNWDTRPFATVDLTTFTFTRLVRDALILVSALGYTQVACVIGHDFGAVAASMCALMRPDVFRSVITMSHPFKGSPSLPFNTVSNPTTTTPSEDIHQALAELPEPRKHYKWYYSTQRAASDLSHPLENLQEFLRGYFHLKSASWPGNTPFPLSSWTAPELAKLPYYYVMPLSSGMRDSVALSMANSEPDPAPSSGWLPDADLAVYAAEWSRTGFQGGLNWYRVGTSPALTCDVEVFAGQKITVPALFVAGAKDWGMYQEPGVLEKMKDAYSQDMFRGVRVVEGAGHWVQQEQPGRVAQLVLGFLGEVKVRAISL
ncbi:alpha/beta-Hydrolase [Diplocarpon rosae]|nr:alpha/beta-Hydrolase [Diplocarpon rosae]